MSSAYDKSKYTTKDLGLTVDCPICGKYMINSLDINCNYMYGICKTCYITYIENKDQEIKERLEKEKINDISDSLLKRDKIREVYVLMAKEIKTLREERIREMQKPNS